MTLNCNARVIEARMFQLIVCMRAILDSHNHFRTSTWISSTYSLTVQRPGPPMPTHIEISKNTYMRRRRRQDQTNSATVTRKHDPTALVDVHPAPLARTLPKSIIQQLISLCCLPHPRKPQRHPSSSHLSPSPPPSPTLPVSSTAQSESTYTSFPAPTFALNGQPRALDSRLHTDSDTPFLPETGPQERKAVLAQDKKKIGGANTPDSKTTNQNTTPQLRLPTLTCPCPSLQIYHNQ